MGILLRVCAVAWALLLAQGVASAATLKNMNLGNWFAGAYSDDETGAFSHCAASSSYRNGISLMFAINKKFAWSIGFANPRWSLTKGTKYPISFSLDGSRTLNATAVAISNTFVEASLADSSALFTDFRYSSLLTVYAADETFKFRLTDTSQLLPMLLRCVKEFNDEAPQSSANPFVAETPPSADTKEPDTSTSQAVDRGSSDRRTEATSLIANILAQSDVHGFEILGPDDVQKFKSDAAWRAGDSFGTIQILDGGITPEDFKAQIISSDAKACNDKFFSGSMPDPSGTRLFTSCRSDTQTMTIFYSMIKRPKGGYYVLATGGIEHQSQGDGKPARELDNGIRSAAYRVVTR